ncbi:MAG: hypothetical protein KGI30_07700 [Planctomycetota bacterium]|nr:hypothetical protein [Planctomycetota bacterium]
MKHVFLRSQRFRNLLACFAERMIERNKKKNEEIKGFLKWLKCKIGAEIDSLTNKTISRNRL